MQEDVAEFLRRAQEGACVWDVDDHGWSPLHWACSRGSTVMTYAILQEMKSSQEAGGHLLFRLPHKGTSREVLELCGGAVLRALHDSPYVIPYFSFV